MSLIGSEKVVAPVEQSLHRALTLRERAVPAAQQAESLLQALEDLRGREHRHPGGRELDGQGHAIELPADLDDDVVVASGVETWRDRARSIDEQPCRLVRDREGIDPPNVFSGDGQRLPSGRQERDTGTAREHGRRETRRRVEHVLAVVQDDHRRPRLEMLEDNVTLVATVGGHAERFGDDRRHGLAIRNRRQVGHPHAVGPDGRHGQADLGRQPCLPHAS